VKPPGKMGSGWSEIWKAVSAEALGTSTRQELAGRLHVSTKTLQRILVDGDVPDFQRKVGTKVLHSWTRTITRLAVYFDRDPWEWLAAVGIERDARLSGIVDAAVVGGVSPSGGAGSPVDPGPVQAGPLQQPAADSVTGHLIRALEKSLPESYVKRRRRLAEWMARLLPGSSLTMSEDTPMRSDGADLYNGVFCHSCLAPLSDPDNRGASDLYCRYCSDESGQLLPRPEVLEVMTDWFMQWQPSLDREEARRRADSYMSAMPAWN
jgi:hypothetical protein